MPHGRSGRMRKTSLPSAVDPRTAQPVASRYTDYALPAHAQSSYKYFIGYQAIEFALPVPRQQKNKCPNAIALNITLRAVIPR
jgi:hypothetical protein